MTRRDRRGDQHGNATVELVVMAPLVVVLLLFLAFLGRVGQAREDVEGASRDAARAASIARSAGAARAAATDAAGEALNDRGVECRQLSVVTDTADFSQGGSVSVGVSCEVGLSDLTLLRLGGSRSVSSRTVAVVDFHRGLD